MQRNARLVAVNQRKNVTYVRKPSEEVIAMHIRQFLEKNPRYVSIFEAFKGQENKTAMQIGSLSFELKPFGKTREEQQNGLRSAQMSTSCPLFICENVVKNSPHLTWQFPIHLPGDPCSTFMYFTSKARFPQERYNQMVPGETSKKSTILNIVELQLHIIMGTLMEYLSTQNVKYAKNVSLLLWNLKFYLDKAAKTFPKFDASWEETQNTIANLLKSQVDTNISEDDRINSAKEFVNSEFNTVQYFWSLQQLSVLDRNVLERNVLPNILPILIASVPLVQRFVDENYCMTFEGLMPILTRLIWERIMRRVQVPNLDECTSREEVTQLIYDTNKKYACPSIRLYAALIRCIRVSFTQNGTPLRPEKIIERYQYIVEKSRQIHSLENLMLFLDPNLGSLYNMKEQIVEQIIGVSKQKGKRRHFILTEKFLTCHMPTPHLDEIEAQILEKQEQAQLMIDSINLQIEESKTENIENENSFDDITIDEGQYWYEEFLESIGGCRKLRSGHTTDIYPKLIELFSVGNRLSISLLKYFKQETNNLRMPCCFRHILNSAVLLPPKDSMLYNYINQAYYNYETSKINYYHWRHFRKLLKVVESVKKPRIVRTTVEHVDQSIIGLEELETDQTDEEILQEVTEKMTQYNNEEIECPICLEEVACNAETCGDSRHNVCSDCREQLKDTCPICCQDLI